MVDALIEELVKVFGTLLITLIGVLGAYLTAKLGKHIEFKSITEAVDMLTEMARQTVGELEQTVVKDLKAASEDHKLTKEEIEQLGIALYQTTIQKMSIPMMKTLEAASVDVRAVIESAGEDWINYIRTHEK